MARGRKQTPGQIVGSLRQIELATMKETTFRTASRRAELPSKRTLAICTKPRAR
jgi:hypothetical protein